MLDVYMFYMDLTIVKRKMVNYFTGQLCNETIFKNICTSMKIFRFFFLGEGINQFIIILVNAVNYLKLDTLIHSYRFLLVKLPVLAACQILMNHMT